MNKNSSIQLNISGVLSDQIGTEHGLTQEELDSVTPPIKKIEEEVASKLKDDVLLKKSMMGWLTLWDQSTDHLEIIQDCADDIANKYQYLLVIGIGGSSLGAKALLHALHYLESPKNRPQIHFLENADPESLKRFENVIQGDYKKVAVNVISKSGTTLETSANFEVVLDRMKAKGLSETDISDRVVATTDKEKGKLLELAREMKFRLLEVPDGVGGRFSVFSDVGLFPLAVAGVDIKALLKGVKKGFDQKNHAFQIGKIFYLLDRIKNKNLHGLFLYGDAFQEIGAWFEQLWAESLGKSEKVGPRPLAMIGTTAQHSVNQDNIAGLLNKAILFVGVHEPRVDYQIPGESVPNLKNKKIHQLLLASMQGTQEALKKRSRPTFVLMMQCIDEHSLGEFLFTLQFATLVAGRLYGVDPFDQPAVEEAKVAARQHLLSE